MYIYILLAELSQTSIHHQYTIPKMKLTETLAFATLVIGALAVALEPHRIKRQDVKGTATINLAMPLGTPRHIASGFLYGIPIAQNQVPDHFYTDMGFNDGRAGGGSEPAPARGWAFGSSEFTVCIG
jgi:hypothetical protein